MNIQRLPTKATTADTGTAAANTAVVITYAAAVGYQHAIEQIVASYSATPTGGALTIEDGAGTTVFQVDLAGAGPHNIPFDPPLMGSEGTALIVTLAAGSGTVVGKLNARHRLH